MNTIYLDHCATTPLDEEVLAAMLPFLQRQYGNPSSIHAAGREARVAVDHAREQVAASLGAQPAEIVFTSGGTESNNMAFLGAASTFEMPRHLITTAIEHPCVLESCRTLERQGWDVSYVRPQPDGIVTAGSIRQALRPETALISVMHANNETGMINPIAEIAALAHERGILFHTDAVQTCGKLAIDLTSMPVSMLTLSAHKFYGPKGAGALFVRRGTKIESLIRGGKQERARRAGTEHVAGIVGLGHALAKAGENRESEHRRMTELAVYFTEKLTGLGDGRVVFNSHLENRLPHVMNFSFIGHDNSALVMRLDLQGIAVSNGSACSSGSVEPSHVLRAMQASDDRLHSAVRFSLGRETTIEELDKTIAVLAGVLGQNPKHVKEPELQEQW